jgi:hypothetical protein
LLAGCCCAWSKKLTRGKSSELCHKRKKSSGQFRVGIFSTGVWHSSELGNSVLECSGLANSGFRFCYYFLCFLFSFSFFFSFFSADWIVF